MGRRGPGAGFVFEVKTFWRVLVLKGFDVYLGRQIHSVFGCLVGPGFKQNRPGFGVDWFCEMIGFNRVILSDLLLIRTNFLSPNVFKIKMF